MGGGTPSEYAAPAQKSGLSPRGRGNPSSPSAGATDLRSIPAWAGEPFRPPCLMTATGVYPRVGGGTCECRRAAIGQRGLSPRGRGNRPPATRSNTGSRSIPAWAGEPVLCVAFCRVGQVYPRVGGGTRWNIRIKKNPTGLSPRGRGNPPAPSVSIAGGGSIPAWAGEPQRPGKTVQPPGVYPRVGGGTRYHNRQPVHRGGLSPRGRGNHRGQLGGPSGSRSIPAWAGEPPAAVNPR